jgi:bacterial/archaeal transporter family protein
MLFRALQNGQASIVVPIDKLSILLTVAFAYLFLKEKLSRNGLFGLV